MPSSAPRTRRPWHRRRADEPRDQQQIAALKAKDAGLDIQSASIASDAFFPFRDGLDALAELGIQSVIQPGGSSAMPKSSRGG